MFTPIKSLLVAGGLALGLATFSAPAAHAGNGITFDAGGLQIYVGDGPRYDRYRDRRYRSHRRHRVCSPRRALNKVRDRGIRRAHIKRIGRKGVVVEGRKRGARVIVGFGKHRSCPVRFVRVKDRYDDNRRRDRVDYRDDRRDRHYRDDRRRGYHLGRGVNR